MVIYQPTNLYHHIKMLRRCRLLSHGICHVDIAYHHIIIVYRRFDINTCLKSQLMHTLVPATMHTRTCTNTQTD